MIIAKKWLKSLMKNDDQDSPAEIVEKQTDLGGELPHQSRPERIEVPIVRTAATAENAEALPVLAEPAPAIKASAPQKRQPRRSEARSEDVQDDSQDDDDTGAREQLTEGEDDPLAPAYCLEDGELMDEDDLEEKPKSIPWSSRIQQSKEFFATELLYRFDLLEREERELLKGSYRVEVRGNNGGIWTVFLDEGLNIVNRREDAEVVFSCQQKDFLQLVNGELNPQLAILAQKVRITGDMKRAVFFQSLLVPAGV